jgi:hypothetical protein
MLPESLSERQMALGALVDRAEPDKAAALAEQLLAADRHDLAAHCGAVLAGHALGPQPFLSALDRFVAALAEQLGRPLAPERLRLAVGTAHQALLRTEFLLTTTDQRNFAPAVFVMLADLARFVADAATRLGDTAMAEAGRAAERRFWLHRDPASGEVLRGYWHADSPAQLQVEVTNHCNLKCTMCPRTTVMSRSLGHMHLQVWDDILASWSGRDRRIELTNPLTGHRSVIGLRGGVRMFYLGEFLMHPEFERIVAIAAARDCSVGIQTNGLLMAKRSVRKRLLDAAPPWIGISIDGFDAATYESLRDGGRWEALKHGIEAFLDERRERGLESRIAMQIMTIVADGEPETKERIGSFLRTIGDGSVPISYLPLTTTLPTSFVAADGTLVPFEAQPLHQVHPNHPSCMEPLQKMQILWDGTVSACCVDANGAIRVGQAGLGVDVVWNGPELRRLKEAHLRHDLAAYGLCQQCLQVDASARPLPKAVS